MLFFGISALLCVFFALVLSPFYVPDVVGQVTADITLYPGAQRLYQGYRIEGSSEFQTKSYVFWTPDSLESVRSHYEHYFPQFTRSAISSFKDYPDAVESDSESFLSPLGFDIILLDANQDHRSWLLLSSYDGDPYIILDNVSRHGTLIIIDTTIIT